MSIPPDPTAREYVVENFLDDKPVVIYFQLQNDTHSLFFRYLRLEETHSFLTRSNKRFL